MAAARANAERRTLIRMLVRGCGSVDVGYCVLLMAAYIEVAERVLTRLGEQHEDVNDENEAENSHVASVHFRFVEDLLQVGRHGHSFEEINVRAAGVALWINAKRRLGHSTDNPNHLSPNLANTAHTQPYL